jgi:hypothetical protein
VLAQESFIAPLCCCERHIRTSRAASPALDIEQGVQGKLARKVKTKQDRCVLGRWDEPASHHGVFLHEFCSSRILFGPNWARDRSLCQHFDWTWE